MLTTITNGLNDYQTTTTMLSHLAVTLPCTLFFFPHALYNRICIDNPSKTTLHNEKVIIFVHGRNGHPNDFIPLMKNINTPEYSLRTVNLGETGETSLDEDADTLKKELMIYPDCQIILVGLSKGGLTIMRYITTMNDSRITKGITIVSPLQGTHLALLLPSTTITHTELGYKSDITQEIATTKVTIPIYHIVSKYDHMIIPVEAAKYDTTDESHIYYYDGYYGHIGITYSIDVANAISGWI